MTQLNPSPTANPALYSAAELAGAVNDWCDAHGVRPLNAQAAASLTERNIHYYRSLGLVSAPARGKGQGFGEKQFLQLIAVRLLQARGLPHRRIQELLYGRSLEALREIRDRGLADSATLSPSPRIAFPSSESWHMIPLSDAFLLVNRSGRPVDPGTLEHIRNLLGHPEPIPATTPKNARTRKDPQ